MRSTYPERSARHVPRSTANDRLKSLWGVRLGGSLLAATLFHVAVFALWSPSPVQPRGESGPPLSRIISLRVPGVHEVSRTPEAIPAPELPTVEELRLDLPGDVVGPLPAFSDPSVEEAVAPPILTMRDEWLEYESFAPILVAPYIRNRTEMRSFLERHYRPMVEFSGVQGVVEVHFWVDESGSVSRAEVAASSGSRSLDRLAIRLSQVLRFSPAMRLGRPVRVLVKIPITFRHT